MMKRALKQFYKEACVKEAFVEVLILTAIIIAGERVGTWLGTH